MSELSPALDEILSKKQEAMTLAVEMDTSKMESLMMNMYLEILQLRNEVVFLRDMVEKKTDKYEFDSYKHENGKKLSQLGDLLDQNSKHIKEIAGGANLDLSAPTVNTEEILNELKKEIPPPPQQIVYINQVVAPEQKQQPQQQRYIPTSTFESVRMDQTPPTNPPVNEPPQTTKSPLQQSQYTSNNQQPSTQPVSESSSRPMNASTPGSAPTDTPMRPGQSPRLPYPLPDRPSLRVSTPEDYERMTPEQASEFLAKAAETLTPAETGRLAVELSEHVKDPNVENIFVNLAQRISPRTNKKIIEEVCTYVDTQLSAKILSALSGKMDENAITDLIKDISKRVAEEETSRIVQNLSEKFDQEDTVSMVIRLCSKMNPQQMSAVVAMLAMNMTPDDSARLAEIIAMKVEPDKQIEFAAELRNRENEKQKEKDEGKVSEKQVESVTSARQAAEKISRQSTPLSDKRAVTPKDMSARSKDSNLSDAPKVTFAPLNFEVPKDTELAAKVEYLEKVVNDLNGIVLDMHTELNKRPSEERKQHLVELFNDLRRVSAKNSRQESRQAGDEREEPKEEEAKEEEVKEEPKEEVRPPPKPITINIPTGSNINTDELLEQFLDVAHAEIENAKHSMTEESKKDLKSTETALRQLITKVSAAQEVSTKKFNSQIAETTQSLTNELQKGSAESKQLYDKLNVVIAQFNERLEGIDKRLTDVSAAAKMPPPIQKLKVSQDGLVDMQPVIDQINAQNSLLADLNSRLVQMEKKEVVQPLAFDQLTEKVQAEEEKIAEVTQVAGNAEKMATNTNSQLTDYIQYQSSEEGQRPFAEINERFNSLEAEIKRIQDANVKMNKDLTGSRAAINTLRSHSEETTAAMEEIKRLADNIREENANVEKHMKNLVTTTQTDTTAINEKIKDITRSIERTDDRVDDLTGKIAELHTNVQDIAHQAPVSSQPSEFITIPPKVATVDQPTSPVSSEKSLVASQKSFVSADGKDSARSSKVFGKDQADGTTLTAQNLEQLQSCNEQILQTQLQLQQQAALLQKTQAQLNAVQREKATAIVSKEAVISSVDQKKFNEISKALSQLQSQLNIMKKDCDKIDKKCIGLQEEKADRSEFKTMFEQFRIAMAELNNRVKSTKKAVSGKVGKEEFDETLKNAIAKSEQDIQTNILASTEIGKTSAESRCLLCGQIKKVEPGQTAEQLQKLNVTPSGDRCLVYGDNGEQFFGRNSNGKTIVTKHSALAPITKPK